MKTKLLISIFLLLNLTLFSQTKGDFRLSIEAGLGLRTASTQDGFPSEFDDYMKDLKSGLNINVQAGYFIGDQWGLGFVYDRMRSENSIVFNDPVFNGVEDIITTSDDIKITFIAPEFLYGALSSNEKHGFLMSVAIGYLGLKNDSTLNTIPLTISGGTVGFKAGVSYDYHITKSIAIGASINLISGALSKIKVESVGFSEEIELEDDQRENLSRVTFNGGIRFYL